MNVWMNKLTAQLYLVTPRWEPLNIKFDEKFYEDLIPEMKAMVNGRKICHGVLMQVGWMVENEHGVWLGLPLSAADQFENLGDV